MTRIIATPAPADSLIAPDARNPACYTDAFRTEIAATIPLPAFIAAFYATPLFTAERAVLRGAGWPSTRAEIGELAQGTRTRFAAWQVTSRRPDEILLTDTTGRTKSWLHVSPTAHGTALWFGSVIVPRDAQKRLGAPMRALIPPHRLYARLLLGAAARGLRPPSRPR